MPTLAKTVTHLKPKLLKKNLLYQRISQRGDSSSYNILLLRYLDSKFLLTNAQIVAYKKNSPGRTDADFPKLKSKTFPNSKTKA